MNIEDLITAKANQERRRQFEESEQLTLGEIIAKLEAIQDKSKPVIFDDRYFPTDIDSWRGIYAELALEYAETGQAISVAAWLTRLRYADGAIFGGYKGGEFYMNRHTPVWVANYGESNGFKHENGIDSQAVTGVTENEQAVILETQNIDV